MKTIALCIALLCSSCTAGIVTGAVLGGAGVAACMKGYGPCDSEEEEKARREKCVRDLGIPHESQTTEQQAAWAKAIEDCSK